MQSNSKFKIQNSKLPAGRSTILALLSLAVFAAAVALFINDMVKTRGQRAGEPAAARIAAANLQQVQSSGSGWFPFQRDPAYGWEQDEQGWVLEDDDPAALTPADRPEAMVISADEDGGDWTAAPRKSVTQTQAVTTPA